MSAPEKRKRKFFQSESLRKALTRDGISMPGATANYLLTEFLHHGGRLRKASAQAAKLCQDKQFDDWRFVLREKGWITYVVNPSLKWMDYYPSPKLVKYINAEKSLVEMATRIELDESTSALQIQLEKQSTEMKKVKERLKRIEEAIVKIQKLDPPITPEKIEDFIENKHSLSLVQKLRER